MICVEGDQLVGLAVQANVKHSARDIVAASMILQKDTDERKLTVIRARSKSSRPARWSG